MCSIYNIIKKETIKKDHTEVRLINDKFTFAILRHVMNGKIHTHYTAVERYKEDFISKYPPIRLYATGKINFRKLYFCIILLFENCCSCTYTSQSYILPNETLMFPLKPPSFLLHVSQTIALCQQFVSAKMYGVINI